MKGKTAMQRTEMMPWKSDGSLHAQVEFHVPVPSVIPAAISAPTLSRQLVLSPQTRISDSLIEVIQQPYTPGSPSTRKSFGKIYPSSNTRKCGSKAQNNPCDNEHGNILCCSLEQYS